MKILDNFKKINLFRVSIFFLFSINCINAEVLNGFNEQIFMSVDGVANVIWQFRLDAPAKNELHLPWNFSLKNTERIKFDLFVDSKKNVKIYDSSGEYIAPVKLISISGTNFISVNSNYLKNYKTFEIRFTIDNFFNIDSTEVEDFGNYTFKKKYVNTTSNQLKDFKSEIFLPEGFVITSVEETIPKQGKDDPVSPFEISRNKNLNSVWIKSPVLKLGDQIFVKFRFKKETKSPVLFIILSLISLGYLYYFRDLIKPVNEKKS